MTNNKPTQVVDFSNPNADKITSGSTKAMTNNKQQTAVDAIIEFCQKQMDNDSSIHKGVYLSIIKFCKEQAKEMEKEQMIEFAQEVFRNRYNQITQSLGNIADDIYNETYGGGNK